MRVRLLAFSLLTASLTIGSMAPARAQGTFYEVAFGRAAFAFWEDFANERFAFMAVGQGVLYNSDVGEPLVGEFGCAAVGTMEKAAFGCGPLASFAIADDLSTASGKGTFDATIFDFETGESTGKGKISFSGRWKATSDASPHVEGGYMFDGGEGFVGTYTGAEIHRHAEGGVKGGVTRSPLGPGVKGPPHGAAILFGPSAGFELHG